MPETKKKKHPGVRTKRKVRPELVGDSYQADKKDLKKIRQIAKKRGCSKAEIIRYGVKLAIQVFNASVAGEESITLDLSEFNGS